MMHEPSRRKRPCVTLTVAMKTYIALLRGINVGGHKQVSMADLRELLTRLGFEGAQSLLQSGNLLFRSKPRSNAALELLLENELKKRLAMQTQFFVRTTEEWRAVIEQNPFRDEAERDPGHLHVVFLKSAPQPGAAKALQDAMWGARSFEPMGGRHTSSILTAPADRS